MVFSEERICLHCGKVFTAKSPSRKYCTDECQSAAKRIRQAERYKNMPKKVCKHCGREFKATHKDQKFCSRACGGKEYNLNDQKRPPAPMPEGRVLITADVPVFPHLQPEVGKIYRALKPKVRWGHHGFYFLVDIQCGGHGLIVRDYECREV